MAGIRNNFIIRLFISKRFRVCRHLALTTIITILTINFLWYVPIANTPAYYKIYAWIIYFILFGVIIYTNLYLTVPRLLLKGKLLQYILTLILFVIVTILIVISVQYFLLLSMNLPENANVGNRLLINILAVFFILSFLFLGTTTLFLIKQKIMSDMERSELETSILESELKLLNNQVNPHFLFNMLNNINGLLRKDRYQASDTLYKLEDLLRYQINKTPKEEVTLESEINFIKGYLNLEKIRRDNFNCSVIENETCKQVVVPPLLFINFVENAVKYSVNLEGVSYVNISFGYVDNKLNFICENSMSEYPIKSNYTSGLGLKNIRRRLDLLYPDLHHLDIKENNSKYTVKLTIEI